MNAEQYVKKIVKNTMCSSQKRKDIHKQLLTEIQERLDAGEELTSVIAQMGAPKEIADNFNETFTDKEKQSFKRKKHIRVALIIVAVLAVIIALLYWYLPKNHALEDSKIFTKSVVENSLTQTIDNLDKDNYDQLKQDADAQMKSILNQKDMTSAKNQINKNWGNRTKIGTIYSVEVTQMGKQFAVCQVIVSYENVSVVYTITFDKDMKLAGLYMREG